MSPDGRTEDGQNYEPREQDMAKGLYTRFFGS